jgi:CheY-like chemotaxis protein
VESWTNAEFDLILMDRHMPVMDGYEATEAIREIERGQGGARTPIVALSAGVLELDAIWGGPTQFDDSLLKPIDLVRLGQVIQRCSSDREEDLRKSA